MSRPESPSPRDSNGRNSSTYGLRDEMNGRFSKSGIAWITIDPSGFAPGLSEQSARPACRMRRSSAKNGATSSSTCQSQDSSSDNGGVVGSSGRLKAKRLTSRPSGPYSSTDDVIGGYLARDVVCQSLNARSVIDSDSGSKGTVTRATRS